jgi:Zn-dependent protease/CBS domain-containing protein
MPGSFRIFRIAGISIEINLSWLIILVLLTASLALDWFPTAAPRYPILTYWALGLLAALLLFASVLAHELSHSLVAKSRGLPVKSITLFIFGGVSNLEREPQSPGIEFQMAFAGPLTSLVIGGVALGAALLVGTSSPLIWATLFYLGFTNLLLAVFNLIPGFPLDGGRVLRSIIWKVTGSLREATRWAARVGQAFAYLLIILGVWQFFTGSLITGLWLGFIGWFLLQAAQAESSQVMLEALFKGVTVSQLMSAAPRGAQGDISVEQLVDSYVLPFGIRSIPVMRGEEFIGLITLEDVRRMPREQWSRVPISDAMTPLSRLHIARPNESLNETLPRMTRNDVNQLPVVDETGRLVGMLSRDAIMRYVEIRRGLGIVEPTRGETLTRESAERPSREEPHMPVTS